MYSQVLGSFGEVLLSTITFLTAMLVLLVAANSYRVERLHTLLQDIQQLKPFFSTELASLRKGVNQRLIDNAVIASASNIISSNKLSDKQQVYLDSFLAPLHNVWSAATSWNVIHQFFAKQIIFEVEMQADDGDRLMTLAESQKYVRRIFGPVSPALLDVDGPEFAAAYTDRDRRRWRPLA